MYLQNITKADRVRLEGREVIRIDPVTEAGTDVVTHHRMAVQDPEEGVVLRLFRVDEITRLIAEERLVIERGFYSPERRMDRQIHGTREIYNVPPKQRARIEECVYLAQRMAHYHRLGMLRTRDGVEQYRGRLSDEYLTYQARVRHGTDKHNRSQDLKPLPASSTLLRYDRLFRMADCDPRVFMFAWSQSNLLTPKKAEDHFFILRHLYRYQEAPYPSKQDVAEATLRAVKQENAARKEAGLGDQELIPVRSVRTYERYIDKYLDPFSVTLHREGEAAARKKFGTTETGLQALFPGHKVQMDFWCFHLLTIPLTRQQWRAMTEEERRAYKPVRRWVVVVIDVATRVILGYAICASPNQAASLQALRMCFMDKTFLLRGAGLQKGHWNYVCPLIEVTTDSGSEFGKHPFGGSRFSTAVRRLSGSLMNTVTGLPHLRGHVERWNWTADRRLARHNAGYTGSNPTKLGERKPHEEACLTDDELEMQFVRLVAEYHSSSHRNLGRLSPADKWQELSADPRFDPSQIPGPAELREACGTEVQVDVGDEGILFEGIRYSNKFVREQRMKPGYARLAKPGARIEALVDPMDLGAISLCTPDGYVSVPAVNHDMRGRRLVDWRAQRRQQRSYARERAEARREEKAEATEAILETAKLVARTAGIEPRQHSFEEVDQKAREILDYGKGQHEKPFIGRDEYQDPLMFGFVTGTDGEDDADPFGGAAHAPENEPWTDGAPEDCPPETAAAPETDTLPTAAPPAPDRAQPDAPGGLDRFRKNLKPRSGGAAWQEDD